MARDAVFGAALGIGKASVPWRLGLRPRRMHLPELPAQFGQRSMHAASGK